MCADKCVIWGGGAHTEFLYQTTSFFHHGKSREYAIVDGDPIKKGKSRRGIEIHSPDVLRELTWSEECLLVSSYGSQPGIVKAATELRVPPDRVVRPCIKSSEFTDSIEDYRFNSSYGMGTTRDGQDCIAEIMQRHPAGFLRKLGTRIKQPNWSSEGRYSVLERWPSEKQSCFLPQKKAPRVWHRDMA
jgi:hypothetical protein